MQLSLDRLNLGPRPAKNKPKWKENKLKKANKKADEKLYNSGAKIYWMAWSVKHEKKK